MSWGATAFTPIVTYNTPPFGFAERPNPSDFPTCPEDPYSGAENIKERIKESTKEFFYSDPLTKVTSQNNYHVFVLFAIFIIMLFVLLI